MIHRQFAKALFIYLVYLVVQRINIEMSFFFFHFVNGMCRKVVFFLMLLCVQSVFELNNENTQFHFNKVTKGFGSWVIVTYFQKLKQNRIKIIKSKYGKVHTFGSCCIKLSSSLVPGRYVSTKATGTTAIAPTFSDTIPTGGGGRFCPSSAWLHLNFLCGYIPENSGIHSLSESLAL